MCHSWILICILCSAATAAEEPEKLYLAEPLTAEGSFTAGIEGPACDQAGNIFAVNFEKQQTIGRVAPDGKGAVFVTLPGNSIGNGLRFDRQGNLYVADYIGHNILKIDPRTRTVAVLAHEDSMNQPNDLAIGPDGTLYASDPSWGQGTGQLWKISAAGTVQRLAAGLGTTNGIELSPDGKTLYVNESVQRNIWAFPIQADGALGEKRLLAEFPDHGFDGMRCDVAGNLYVTRHGKGVVAVVSPQGKVLREIDVLGKMPSNLCFGGPDGRTVYVTEVERRRLVQFRVERPGLEWLRWREGPSSLEADPGGWEDLMPRPDFQGWRRVALPQDSRAEKHPWSASADGKILSCKGKGVKEMLLHEKERADGIFHVEWRVADPRQEEYNGGVYVRTRIDGKIWHQAQVAMGPKGPVVGDLFTEVSENGETKRVEVKSPLPSRARPPGEWNAFEVTCRGKTISLWVNGAVTAELASCQEAKGHIGLQVEFYDLEFRNLKFKPMR
ncbi:MAG: SMP-30/gluconolactonase/LRE family protein [Planctomycetes bacterium]|nr:SMP-30/gluconolactonase/LRE family protein [Planctomycetota bacterium]